MHGRLREKRQSAPTTALRILIALDFSSFPELLQLKPVQLFDAVSVFFCEQIRFATIFTAPYHVTPVVDDLLWGFQFAFYVEEIASRNPFDLLVV